MTVAVDQKRAIVRAVLPFVLAVVLLSGGLWLAIPPRAAEDVHAVPPPAIDEKPVPGIAAEQAIFAGGCFWGVQGVYQHVKGVANAVSGYTGGQSFTADYETVSTGTSGHAESVRITYDPNKISYGQLLQIFFAVVHDPTTLNRQGPDVGSQYRSAIFPTSDEQARIAKAYVAQLNDVHAFEKPVVTKIETNKQFYKAEQHHQDFLALNPTYPYIVFNDLPKVANLKRTFPDLYRDQAVLVRTAHTE